MTLEVRRTGVPPDAIGEWPLPGLPLFVPSHAFRTLQRDLRRYLADEIAGRSYLIAGHRGAGKTALASRAVSELAIELLKGSATTASAQTHGRVALQRPLIVKLHGQSLLEPPLPARPAPLRDKDGAVVAAPPEKDTKPPEEAEAALVQFTIALYRAFAGEISNGYAAHARDRKGLRQGQSLEFAAQLALELDSGCDPDLLRSYWERLQRLGNGVLWPRDADPTLAARGVASQGLREIVALTTAGQAFQVCSGAISYEVNNKSDWTQKADVATSDSTDLKDVLMKLGTLGAGALTSTALAITGQDPLVLAAGGGLVWLLGTLSFTWSTSRSSLKHKSSDYTFLRDFSIGTLDRDLPLVIRRIREAGLAPVFVIDELDKVKDARKKIASVINRLKHITSDFGFFCFLTNRDYYDEVDRAIQEETYPAEHTYFGERLLVLYEPKDIFEHLTRVVVSDSPDDDLPRAAFALATMHKAKLNFADIGRAISLEQGDGNTLAPTADALRTQLHFRLKATVQLAVEDILGGDAMARRCKEDPAFAHLAVDTLYALSRAWERGDTVFNGSREALDTYLKGRLKASRVQTHADPSTDATPPDPDPDPRPEPRIDPSDLDALEEAQRGLFEHLKDFSRLKGAVRTRPDNRTWRLDEIIPEAPLALLVEKTKPQAPDAVLLEFTHNLEGRPARPVVVTRKFASEVRLLVALANELELLTSGLQTPFDELTRAVLLPATLSWSAILKARQALATFDAAIEPTEAVLGEVQVLRTLKSALDTQGPRLGAALILVGHICRQASLGPEARIEVVRLLARYPVFGPTVSDGTWTLEAFAKSAKGFPDLRTAAPLAGDAPSLAAWRAEFTARQFPLLPEPSEDVWEIWRGRFQSHFDGEAPPAGDIRYWDLVRAARKLTPFSVLRADPGRLTAGELSQLVLASLPKPSGGDAPRWMLIASLRLLGFSHALLSVAASAQGPYIQTSPPPASPSPAFEQAAAMAVGAPVRRAGVLVITEDPGMLAELPDLSSGRPVLYVSEAALALHGEGLDWLTLFGAFEGVLYESDEEPSAA
jgi:hypothetical protein